ncbi:hypothetical protein ABZY44_17950 [Streptomyces sp. NPDC006544]|uniref:hypothetical protein n=1 Tax=Streptomyces sp. NPDC006544 TaxID=3154583 RepID=UPI0033BF7B8B
MTRWIRIHESEYGLWSYFELDDEGWARRQVGLRSSDHQPMVGADLAEVLRLRGQADFEALSAYEHRYGVLAEGSFRGWGEAEGASEISGDAFEQVWHHARTRLDGVAGTAAEAGSEGSSDRSEAGMTRDELSALLDEDTTACRPARAALLSGGHFAVGDGLVPAGRLGSAYGMRLRRIRLRGQQTLALEETVSILQRAADEPVRTGEITATDRSWTFMLFLDATASTVLACGGVSPPPAEE